MSANSLNSHLSNALCGCGAVLIVVGSIGLGILISLVFSIRKCLRSGAVESEQSQSSLGDFAAQRAPASVRPSLPSDAIDAAL